MLIILQKEQNKPLGCEEQLVASWASKNGFEIKCLSLSALRKSIGSLVGFGLAVGDLGFMKAAFSVYGSFLPPDNCYPASLRHLLGRDVREASLNEAYFVSEKFPIFVKPRTITKKFTGRVIHGGSDYWLSGLSRREPVWICEEISFVSEWRFYVRDSKVFHYHCYDGDCSYVPDLQLVDDAVSILETEEIRDFVLDFGFDAHGKMLMIEMNDAFSVGAYGQIDAEGYSVMLLNRWRQITGKSPS